MAKHRAPRGLGPRAKSTWTKITDAYELRIDELLTLESACREVDLIARLERELAKTTLIVEGSMGQPVASPLVQELRQHRLALQRLLASLKLPDEDGKPQPSRATGARAAAAARWQRGA